MKNARNVAEFVSTHLSDESKVEQMTINLLKKKARQRKTQQQSRNSPERSIVQSFENPYRPISMKNNRRNIKSQSQLQRNVSAQNTVGLSFLQPNNDIIERLDGGSTPSNRQLIQHISENSFYKSSSKQDLKFARMRQQNYAKGSQDNRGAILSENEKRELNECLMIR